MGSGLRHSRDQHFLPDNTQIDGRQRIIGREAARSGKNNNRPGDTEKLRKSGLKIRFVSWLISIHQLRALWTLGHLSVRRNQGEEIWCDCEEDGI